MGKTTSIRLVWNKLKSLDTEIKRVIFQQGEDFYGVMDYNGKKIGFCSQGDPDSQQKEWLRRLAEEDSDIIICASRTRGQTVHVVEQLAKDTSSELIWISPFYSISETLHSSLNECSAEAIISLINKL